MINYIESFPLPSNCIPEKLKQLLTPISVENPDEKIEITARFEADPIDDDREYVHMIMASVPEKDAIKVQLLNESSDGVVSFSEPFCDNKADIADWSPSISGYDYLVASWGDGSFYSYNLAEKIWMALGLSGRTIGNTDQKIIYDDLSLPMIAVAEGEVTNEHYWHQNRNVLWTMRNDYLRDYLWMRGQVGVRVFFYEKLIEDEDDTRAFMQGKEHHREILDGGWYDLNIREHNGKLLMQVWATVVAVSAEKCKRGDIFSLVWPGDTEPITKERAKRTRENKIVYLKDTFLEKYEKNSVYNSVPFIDGDVCLCSPSYLGQWAFTNCTRIGRNLIKVHIYDLYKGVPAQEILHAYKHAISTKEAETYDLKQEDICSKSHRLLDALISLGENLSQLSTGHLTNPIRSNDFSEFSRQEFVANGILNYPIIQKLSQIVPLEMYEQDFLSRCKTLHEILGRVKTGSLKKILEICNCPKKEINQLGSLKLIQTILNILSRLNENDENAGALINCAESLDWGAINPTMAPLFINNDLRIADAHETIGKSMKAIERLGFDTKKLDGGYGNVLDFILDGTINALKMINSNAADILNR